MPDFTLPSGLYLSVADMVRARFGGQTRAHLMRNRFFTQHAGVPTKILTFDAQPVYPLERERLVARGELVPGMELLNQYEYYRENEVPTGPPTADALPPLPELAAADVPHPDGTVYYTAYRVPETEVDVIRDYRRPDGTVFLRSPGPDVRKHRAPWVLTDRLGRPVQSWPNKRGWCHHWLLTLLGEGPRAFVISDSRAAMLPLLPVPDERFHALQLFHNVHMSGDRSWNAPVGGTYKAILDQLENLDGLVTLTDRQRADIVQRVGRRSNLFTVSNPVTLPARPDPLPPRPPAQFTIVSRFEAQKRLDHAVQAFALVVAERPQALLDIYGEGSLRGRVEALVAELGLQDHVRLRGWDPDARDTLWTSSGFLVTSGFEGYPLAILESLARGCPVVSYDVKYGPRDQITDGVDGFLVPDRDQRALADRVIAMVDDPGLVARMSTAALATAEQHDYRAFLQRWSEILERVVAAKPRRVHLQEVTCTVHRLGHLPTRLPGRLRSRLPERLQAALLPVQRGSASLGSSRPLVLDADLAVRGTWPRGALAKAELTLVAVSDATPQVTRLPLEVRPTENGFRISSTFTLDRVFRRRAGEDHAVTLRLRLVLRNAAWETTLTRPAEHAPGYEISYGGDGTLTLARAVRDRGGA